MNLEPCRCRVGWNAVLCRAAEEGEEDEEEEDDDDDEKEGVV